MSNKYVSPSNLERYDGKIKEYIENKISSGTGNSSDDTNLVSIDLDELIASEKTPEDVFPSLDGLCVRISTLAEGDDTHYPEYGMGNYFIKEEELFLPVKFSEWYDDGNSYRYNLYEFASPTHKLSIGYYETGDWQLTFDADKSGDYWAYKIESCGQGYDDTALSNRVTTLETNLGSHTVKSDVPENAVFTDTTNFLPLAGGTMDENAKIVLPSTSYGAEIKIDNGAETVQLYADGLYVENTDSNETTQVNASSVTSPEFVGDLTGKVNGYTIGASVPSNAKFTDTDTVTTVTTTGTGNAITAISATNGAVTATKGNSFLPLSGGTVTGDVIFQSEEKMIINDWGLTGNGNQTISGFSDIEADNFTGDLSGNAKTATTATKLGTANKGSATQPIYLNAGNPTACTYTLGKSVPSDAVFTDTVYTLPTASSSTLGGVKTTSTVTSNSGYTACPIISGVPYYKPTSGADAAIYQSTRISYGGTDNNVSAGGVKWGSGCSYQNTGSSAYVIGENCTSAAGASFTTGYNTQSNTAFSMAIGKYNDTSNRSNGVHCYVSWMVNTTTEMDAFMIGNGTSDTNRGNAFRITSAGKVYALSAFNSSGADYAEFVSEWADGNPDYEDRVGYFVTLKDNKLYKANDGDYILGITSGNPSVVGNGDETYFWKYERDKFNRFIYEDKPLVDEEGNEIVNEETGEVYTAKSLVVSKDYDSTQQYIARKDRPEWDYVGMKGVIPLRDDGTCVVNGYCKCGPDGIATIASEIGFFTYYVKERISDNIISVVI